MQEKKLPNGHGVIKLNIDKLEEIRGAIDAKFVTQVGILGSKARGRKETEEKKGGGHKKGKADADLTNADIGLKHEKGSLSEKIPRRSFLEMPLTISAAGLMKTKDAIWKAFQKEEVGLRAAYIELGHNAEKIIQEAFETSGFGTWAPNSRLTKTLKKSDRPLIDTGQLRKSIMSRVVTK